MSYTIYKKSSPGSNPIIVPDVSGNNYSTSLTLIGKNAPGFGQQLAENFVHMLENFAGSNIPTNPIEGQLWFDTRDPLNKKLVINDGLSWVSTNYVWKKDGPIEPTGAVSGDLWIDTLTQQLKLYNGTDYVIVGPATSGTTKTGPYPESLLASDGNTYNVITDYIDNTPIAIVSGDNITPVSVINNFPTSLSKGITLANDAILNGTAKIASNLQTTLSGPVLGDNFLRNDVPQRTRNTLSIGIDANALQIGYNSTFILQRRGESGFISNFSNTYSSTGTNASGRFTFDVQLGGLTKTLLTVDGSNQQTTVDGNLSVTGKLDFLPAGTIISYAGNTVPKGWLLCDGATTGTLAHPTLYVTIGTTYGSTTSTNFRVPNMTPIAVTTGTAIKYIIRT